MEHHYNLVLFPTLARVQRSGPLRRKRVQSSSPEQRTPQPTRPDWTRAEEIFLTLVQVSRLSLLSRNRELLTWPATTKRMGLMGSPVTLLARSGGVKRDSSVSGNVQQSQVWSRILTSTLLDVTKKPLCTRQ